MLAREAAPAAQWAIEAAGVALIVTAIHSLLGWEAAAIAAGLYWITYANTRGGGG